MEGIVRIHRKSGRAIRDRDGMALASIDGLPVNQRSLSNAQLRGNCALRFIADRPGVTNISTTSQG